MKRLVTLIAASALVLAACGDDDGGGVREIDDGGSESASGARSGTGSAAGSGSASGVAAECVPFGNADDADTTVPVELDDFTIAVDETDIPAGTVHFALDNVGDDPHEFVVISGVAPADLPLDADGALDEEALPDGALVGEVEPFPSGETCDGTFELAAGDYTLLCNIVEEEESGETESHVHEGMVTTLTVTG